MRGQPAHVALVLPRGPHEVSVLSSGSVTRGPPPAGLHHTPDKEVVIARADEELELEAAGGRLFLDAVEVVQFFMHGVENLLLKSEGEVLLLEFLLI